MVSTLYHYVWTCKNLDDYITGYHACAYLKLLLKLSTFLRGESMHVLYTMLPILWSAINDPEGMRKIRIISPLAGV